MFLYVLQVATGSFQTTLRKQMVSLKQREGLFSTLDDAVSPTGVNSNYIS